MENCSKHTLLLPTSWIELSLDRVALWGSGGTPSRKNQEYYQGNIPWIKTGELKNKYIRDTEEKITAQALQKSSAKIFAKGSIAIAMYGATIGKTSILGIDASSNQACAIAQPISKIIFNEFLYYYLYSQTRNFIKLGKGGAQPNISQTVLKSYPIFLPPLAEQHRIVDKIEELFSDLDAGIESLKTARSQLKIYRQAVLKWAFEGKLTADWRQEQQRKGKLKSADELLAQIKIDREQHYQQQLKDWEAAVKAWESDDKVGKKPTKPQKINNVEQPSESDIFAFPPLPNEWGYIRAESISDFITKGTTPSKEELNNGHGDIPFVKVYNLTNNGTLDFSINPTFVSNETHRCFLSRSKVLPGDILMNIVGPPLGKVSLAPDIFNEWNINQAIARYRPLKIIFNKYLLHYLLFQGTIDRMSKKAKATVGQFNLTLEICRDIEVPICSKEEQYKIVEEIESRLSVCDNLETTIAENLQRAESLRQSILKQAFEGKLVPQDPNDEPAAQLLERIKQAKAAPQQPQQLEIPLAGTTSHRKTKPV